MRLYRWRAWAYWSGKSSVKLVGTHSLMLRPTCGDASTKMKIHLKYKESKPSATDSLSLTLARAVAAVPNKGK